MRMVLQAYVCLNGKVTHVQDVGTSTIADIMQRRPGYCQYAVVSMGHPHEGETWVIDLYEVLVTARDVSVGAHSVYSTLDAAIAATVLRLS